MDESAGDPYENVRAQYEQVVALQDADGVLGWDQQVMMPPGGTPARSKQRSTLSTLEHDLVTDPTLDEHLSALEGGTLSAERDAEIREIRRLQERQQAVPRDLIAARSETSSEALEIWQKARAEEDFSIFAPILERQVELAREYAAHIDPDRDRYAVLFEDYEPYLGLATAERVLTRLREALVPRIDAIRESEVTLPDPFSDPVDAETQAALARDALDVLGYDWDRGRLDTAPHPFSMGTQFDARVTTRFDEAEPLSSLLSTIHEFGHARYTLGLPEAAYGSPLGQDRGLTVHESQSRLWENHLGRSRSFWQHFTERMAERVPAIESEDPELLYRAVNRVDPESLIRVEADELNYHLHIVLRFEIERDLIAGELDVADVPAVWNEKMEQYLGVRPETPSEGALQDIHWSHGNFGYFPTYSLGSVLAAQLYDAAKTDLPDLGASIARGETAALADWLETAIHRHGRRYRTGALIERATGQSLSVDPFIEYVDAKFGDLYDIEV
ncbi:MAG: carboxypeptidase M32 [Halodesulfurarchaeum sp.]